MEDLQLPDLARLELKKSTLNRIHDGMRHLLIIVQDEASARDAPGYTELCETLKRRAKPFASLAKESATVIYPGGCLSRWVLIGSEADAFTRLSRLREACQGLLTENPTRLDIAAFCRPGFRTEILRYAAYVAWLNGAPLPSWKTERSLPLKHLVLHGAGANAGLEREQALAEANTLTRSLTVFPPNHLTPARYRKLLARMARQEGWRMQTHDLARLKKMGAGAFVAVAQGSDPADAAIVKLEYRGKTSNGGMDHIALVGKGICFDTGGHNLKPARYMQGMHEDMAGSAVALGILLAAARLHLPLRITVWLALAQNHISPVAYKQGDIVTALDGTSIEIVHTDAEGRMVLADTLTLATREKPSVIVDFATLTGSMQTALGTRFSGVLANCPGLLDAALKAGEATGERVCAFPLAEDYGRALDSECADVKQCTMEGEADHILAALFLKRFIKDTPWIHMDLSASRCKEGLGGVATEVTGFGVAWGMALLDNWQTLVTMKK